jgi:short-subunit dehydrogenase
MVNGKTGMNLTDAVAVITGASAGIGAALARLLASKGMRLVIGARRGELLSNLAREIDPAGMKVVPFTADVSRRDQAEALVDEALNRFGRIDVLVNNAGHGHFGSVEDTSDETIERIFAVNTFALWYASRPALEAMRRQGSGHILTVSSMAGVVGFPFNSAYVAAKHAAVGFTRALRMELIGTGINASVVLPGGVATDWAEKTEGGPMLPMFQQSGPIAARIAAERAIVPPEMEGVMPPQRVADAIYECILHPIPEVFTHAGTRDFARLTATDPEQAEHLRLPSALAERSLYATLRKRRPLS